MSAADYYSSSYGGYRGEGRIRQDENAGRGGGAGPQEDDAAPGFAGQTQQFAYYDSQGQWQNEVPPQLAHSANTYARAVSGNDPYFYGSDDPHYGPQADMYDHDDGSNSADNRVSSYFPLKWGDTQPPSPQRYQRATGNDVPATELVEYPVAPPVLDSVAGRFSFTTDEHGGYSGGYYPGDDRFLADSGSTAAASSSRQRNQSELGRASSDVDLSRRELSDDAATLRSQDRYAGSTISRLPLAASSLQNDENKRVSKGSVGKEQPPPAVVASRADNMPKVLMKPKVAKQYAKRVSTTYRPYFLWLVTSAQVLLLVVSLFINNQQTGKFIESLTLNPMIGPASLTLIGMGARFTPCMRPLAAFNSTVTFSCPASATTCGLEEICGFGGFKSGKPDQWFRFIVPIFLHGGVIHLLFNMLFQVRTGIEMEKDMGTFRFGAIYVISGVAGNIFGANFAPVMQQSIGASSSLFGLIGCLLLDLLQNWKLIVRPAWELTKMLLMIAVSFVLGLLPGFDNFAHIGGFMGGFISGFIFLPRIHFGKWDRRVKIGAVVIAVPLLVVLYTLALSNFYNAQNPADSCSWCRYLSCLPVHGWCDAFDNNGI